MTDQKRKSWLTLLAKRAGATGALVAALCVGGCLPGADSDEGTFKATFGKFTSSEGDAPQVNRADKKDALLSMRAVDELGEGLASTVRSVRRAGEQLVSIERAAPVTGSIGSTLPDAEPTTIDAALFDFYKALRTVEARKRDKPLTIVQFGDDHITSDRFSGDLREQFQSRFGQSGRGMLQPGLFPARGVKFDRGGQWRSVSSVDDSGGIYGATGLKLATKASDAWLRLTADGAFDWVEVTLETGPKQGSAIILIDGEAKVVPTAAASPDWKKIRLNRPGRELTIRAKGDGEIKVHSWMIGNNRPGVNFVNMGLPRATALTPERWSPSLLAADLKSLEPSLIILSYGTVEGFDDTLNMPAYEQRLLQVIGRMKIAAPEASFLIIGPPDAARMPAFATSQGGGVNACRGLTSLEAARYAKWMRKGDTRLARWHAPPKLHGVRTALKRIAAHVNAYYWDWSKIMGGQCGIHAWVHAEPPLASGDHVQLTAEGAKRSARSLFNELMGGYSVAGAATAQKR